ncbi:hypothetical protein EsH8_VII_000553 [Colletotrichum jinshuiense]
MEAANNHSRHRAPGREHIPLYPKGFIAIRIVQLILALIITGLCAFSIYVIPFTGNCFMIFVSISTMIVTTWLIVAELSMPKLYNYWAVLALDIFLVIFWLCSFAVLAAQVGYSFGGSSDCYYGYCVFTYPYGIYLIVLSCMAAAAGLGGLQFALFAASLSVHGVMLHRHRKAGLHCTPFSASITPGVNPGTVSHVISEKNASQVNTNPGSQPANQGQTSPPYMQNQQAFVAGVPQHQNQSQQQHQQQQPPLPQQQIYAPTTGQAQRQTYYPQQSPAHLIAQHTGGSFAQAPPQQTAVPPLPNAHEVPGNAPHAH